MSSVACCKSDFAISVAIEFNLGIGLRIGLGLGVVVRMRMLDGARAGRGGEGYTLDFSLSHIAPRYAVRVAAEA